MRPEAIAALGGFLLASAAALAQQPAPGGEWLSYNNGLHGQRYSPLKQIGPGNAARLGEVCRVQIDGPSSFHAGLVVQGDTLYTATPRETVALDATTCALRWKFTYRPEEERCGGSSRGVALHDGRIFRGTCDGRLIALDAATGRRLSSQCTRPREAREAELARWPALLSPWLPAADRAAARLPPLAADCAEDGLAALGELRIEGVQDGARLARPPGSARGVRLSLRALGAQGEVQWLLDGRWLAGTEGARPLVHEFGERGAYTLTALADSGAWARVEFQVLR